MTLTKEENLIAETVKTLTDRFKHLWWSSEGSLPDLGPAYSFREQYHKEKELGGHLDSLLASLRNPPQNEVERLAAEGRIASTMTLAAKALLGFEDLEIEAIREYGFADLVMAFVQEARRFDPEISGEDIYQASRNVWSMYFMQLLMGHPVRLTPSIFAYSLLYPYSDNYLDDPDISWETKIAFNQRFRHRVSGDPVVPANRHERRISDLIGMIEAEYDRASYPLVFESLLAIHQAQARSLSLSQQSASPYEVDVLGITFEKGGTSVLADGYLVAGDLTEAQQDFSFLYGVFTQLMDDLEDLHQDRKEGRLTLFSQTAGHWPLDAITNRTFHLGHHLLDRIDAVDFPGTQPFKRVLRKSFDPLLIASVGEAGRYYTRPYLRSVEAHSPVRFSFLRKQRRKLSRLQVSVVGLVEAFAHSG